MKKISKSWAVPVVIAGLLFIAVRPTLAQLSQEQSDLTSYITTNDLEVGVETVDGYSQVYYSFASNKVFITHERVNSTHPHSKGRYIVYRKAVGAEDQIVLYDVLSKETVQLTHSGSNTNPRVTDDGRAVWEKWVDNGWQVFFFDGKSVNQLTSGDPSMNVDIDGDFITYSRRDVAGTWRAVVYSLLRKKAVDVTTGEEAKHFEVKEGKVILNSLSSDEKEEFPLTVEDLFLLDFESLGSEDNTQSTVAEGDILEELRATDSAEILPQTNE